ncbi:MAG: hypothetical protein ABS79_02330 [Planctomycetes bacterium SCN 63-9]|nr:MAG: hypothetical protein ABS79_02330 [Planctomycetes bacterium SCN 63-9]
MSTIPASKAKGAGDSGQAPLVVYPESDGKPLGETGIHIELMFEIMGVLRRHFQDREDLAILANMFLYYQEGNPRKNVSPDIFVTLGVPSNPHRRTFKVWEEGKAPDCIIELTSKGTRNEDRRTKFQIYQDILRVREYFLFDPEEEYLKPSLQGFRLVDGKYAPILPEAGRLPSEVLGLHFERDELNLRLHDPLSGRWIPNAREVDAMYWEAKEAQLAEEEARRREEEARHREEEARHREEEARRKEEAARKLVESENERLRKEIQELRKRLTENL